MHNRIYNEYSCRAMIMTMIYFVLLGLLVLAGLAFYVAGKTKPRNFCPTCQSHHVRQLSKEPVQVQSDPRGGKRGVVIGSFRAHVRYELKFKCERCNAKWQYETSAPPE